MNKNLLNLVVISILLTFEANMSLFAQDTNPYPFSTDKTHLTIWNGSEYVPFFIKGVNLGIAVPGTFPGEMAATAADYTKWFKQIKEAGFNCIRVYTLHYPRFFEALSAYNHANPENPLLFLQGVWLEEELAGYKHNLYFLSNAFKQEIEENVDCVHGKKVIPMRVGKAYGAYTTDVSAWCLGYIIGREVYPEEVNTTNTINLLIDKFEGNYLKIKNASASEAWFTSMLDHTVSYEQTNYKTQRPVSVSSWPTLDPITHKEEINREEDTAKVDLSKIELSALSKAGFFISYHAYPYYPDFIGRQSSYKTFIDDYGLNNYKGYLTDLKSHYQQYPLIIAEYGVPSSWVIAHYTSSGMNHGGFDEFSQGLTNIRLLTTIKETLCGGGIQFSWIDEWFKKTWITDPIDYIADSRVLWHNVASAEQNFGLVSFEKEIYKDTLIKYNSLNPISHVNAMVNYKSFDLEIGLKKPLDIPDQMWIALDTYSPTLGESISPAGDKMPIRAEYALHITNYSAKLYVTQAYDLFGIWHNFSDPLQLYHTIATDGAPWNIVRMRNNSYYSDVQYIGNLQVNYDFQPYSSKDGVTISDDKITVRLPWSYINVVSPDQIKVFNDDRSTNIKEDVVSDGFLPAVYYKSKWYTPENRYKWEPWVRITDYSSMERLKTSYYVMQDNLTKFNTSAVAVKDSFKFEGPSFPVTVNMSDGLLKNDFDLDGSSLVSLVTENPANGRIYLNNDGSFDYIPNQGFTGMDSLMYCVYDGYTLSQPNVAYLFVAHNISNNEWNRPIIDGLDLSPNPCSDMMMIKSEENISSVQIFTINGKLVETIFVNSNEYSLNVSGYHTGVYLAVAKTNGAVLSKKFIKK